MGNFVAFLCGIILFAFGISGFYEVPFLSSYDVVEKNSVPLALHMLSGILLMFASVRSQILSVAFLKIVGAVYLILVTFSWYGGSSLAIPHVGLISFNNEYTYVHFVIGASLICLGILTTKKHR